MSALTFIFVPSNEPITLENPLIVSNSLKTCCTLLSFGIKWYKLMQTLQTLVTLFTDYYNAVTFATLNFSDMDL